MFTYWIIRHVVMIHIFLLRNRDAIDNSVAVTSCSLWKRRIIDLHEFRFNYDWSYLRIINISATNRFEYAVWASMEFNINRMCDYFSFVWSRGNPIFMHSYSFEISVLLSLYICRVRRARKPDWSFKRRESFFKDTVHILARISLAIERNAVFQVGE